MTPKLPVLTGAELIRALAGIGFLTVRQRGSHVIVRRRRPDGTIASIPIPVHAGKTLKTGTLRGILRLAGLSADELCDLL